MRQSRLVWTSLALWAVAGFITLLLASGAGAGNSASKAAGCPASAQCSAAQAAACKASGMKCPAGGASAASLTLVSAGPAAKSDKGQCCAEHGSSASAAQASASAPACRGEGLVKMADASEHADCDGCADMSHCAQEISVAGGRVQIVPLKNGVMYVYTAESSAGVRAVQAAVSHRNDRLTAWTTAGDHVKLCSECKLMRGAAASGKLNREVVSIEGGCLTLMTSSDPAIVTRLHEIAAQSAVRSKS